MQVPLQITMHGVQQSEALEAEIRERVAKLEQFYPRMISCRVTVDELSKHHRQGRQFTLRLDVHVPGKEIVVTRDRHEDIYVALREAFDAAKRQIEDVIREQRGDVKAHPIPQHGRVARIFADEGYGFIETPDGRELYFSRVNVVHPDFDRLEPGTPVQFIEEMADEGPQAKRVSVGKHGIA
ncbi:MAG: HPF/RaiA family ribosome-associated protein [Burkholderiaceae bacterium]|jgi:ribosomal subunit interface protein|nr:HPF/RaiA family ribosome-associated protein [Burkholderiaceae bacterium]